MLLHPILNVATKVMAQEGNSHLQIGFQLITYGMATLREKEDDEVTLEVLKATYRMIGKSIAELKADLNCRRHSPSMAPAILFAAAS
jgi:hypothetical protein